MFVLHIVHWTKTQPDTISYKPTIAFLFMNASCEASPPCGYNRHSKVTPSHWSVTFKQISQPNQPCHPEQLWPLMTIKVVNFSTCPLPHRTLRVIETYLYATPSNLNLKPTQLMPNWMFKVINTKQHLMINTRGYNYIKQTSMKKQLRPHKMRTDLKLHAHVFFIIQVNV